jgi:hypothetical protein
LFSCAFSLESAYFWLRLSGSTAVFEIIQPTSYLWSKN